MWSPGPTQFVTLKNTYQITDLPTDRGYVTSLLLNTTWTPNCSIHPRGLLQVRLGKVRRWRRSSGRSGESQFNPVTFQKDWAVIRTIVRPPASSTSGN